MKVRFLAVGAAGFGANIVAFAVLYGAGIAYGAAAVAAYLASNLLMYLGNRYLTFQLGHSGFWTAYARYVTVGLVVAGLTAAVLAVLVELASVAARPAQVLAILAVTPVAFALIKRWTFRVTAVVTASLAHEPAQRWPAPRSGARSSGARSSLR